MRRMARHRCEHVARLRDLPAPSARLRRRAKRAFRRALALAPDDALILTNLGSVLVDGDDFEHAEPWFSRALARDPDLLYRGARSLANVPRAFVRLDGLATTLHARIIDAHLA